LFACHPQLQLFLRELAFALLIASVFGLTLEQIQRREFIKLVTEERDLLKQDVFLYAYGFNLPNQIREEIRNSVLRSNFYREDLCLEWDFSAPNANGLIQVRKQFSYTLVNNSNDPAEWPFRFSQIGADDTMAVEGTIFRVLKIQRPDGTIEEVLPATMKQERSNDQPHMKAYISSIRIGGLERVRIHYELTQGRRGWGDDKFSSREMMIGTATVKLRFPVTPEFEVTVSCKQKPLRGAPDGDPPRVYSFEFKEGMFPHQGIVVSWSIKKDAQLKFGCGKRGRLIFQSPSLIIACSSKMGACSLSVAEMGLGAMGMYWKCNARTISPSASSCQQKVSLMFDSAKAVFDSDS
jgi:hypothetical protein